MKIKIIELFVCLLFISFSFISNATVINENEYIEKSYDYGSFNKNSEIGSSNLDFWLEQDKLLSSIGEAGDYFGVSIAIDGNYAIVGASGDDNSTGSAYIYNRSGTDWIEEQKLTASDGEAGDYFGVSIAIDGNYAIVGASGDDNSTGSAYIYNRSGTDWIEEQKLTASDGEAGDYFGVSVAVDRNYAIVGAYGDDDFTGSVYVFNNAVSWIEEKLLAPDAEIGDCFGNSISLDSNFILIGAYGDNNYAGAAYVLEICCYWKLREKLNMSGDFSFFGWSVSIDGDYAIIGAPGEFDSNSTGSAFIFKRDDDNWYEETSRHGENFGDYFGVSVAVDRNYAIVGASGDDNSTGSAYIYNRSGTDWIEEQKLTASDGEAGDNFGNSVSIDAGYSIISAFGDDNGIGSAYVFMNSGVPDLSIEINGGFGVRAIITNNGDNDAINLDVEIQVKGGILGMINKSTHKTIDIVSGESEIIETGIFFGIGKVEIIVKTGFEDKMVEGNQILIITIID